MQIQLTADTEAEALTIRAITARAAEHGTDLFGLLAPWINDQANAAVHRESITVESVEAAEVRGRIAVEARANAESTEAPPGN